MTERPVTPAHHRLTRAVARGLRQRCGVGVGGDPEGAPPPGGLLVAVSGGADSVALLRALHALAVRRGWQLRLIVGHVQHHLRGDAAERDAAFVQRLADQLGLPLGRADLQPPPRAANVEAWARRERYGALAQMAREHGATYIVTAHHADDQLETLLLRMLRGTAVTGLRGIAWRRGLDSQVAGAPLPEAAPTSSAMQPEVSELTLIRPMLAVTRADVLDFLHAIGQSWCEDHTNADVTRNRARLRHEVLPVLRDMRADAARQATRLADHARDVHRMVRQEVRRQHERLVRREEGALVLDRGAARALPRVVLTALLRRLLREAGVPADRLTRRVVTPVVRAVRDGAGGERRFELAGGVEVVLTRVLVRVSAASV